MGLFDALKNSLEKTRKNFTEKIEQLVAGYATIDDELLEELEYLLITADVGVATTSTLIEDIKKAVKNKEINDPEDIKPFLKTRIRTLLTEGVQPPKISKLPAVILVVGVNGVGKTTTIGKLGSCFHNMGYKVMFAAGDTFRAAAAEQLEIWGKRAGAEVIKHAEGADPAAVVYDALQAAKSRGVDMLIIDTAGRLHNKSNLMEELKKIHRVIKRDIPEAPHETLLVLDATTGQNALNQAKVFKEAAQLTGVALTKLDGTAKGGVVIAVKAELGIPVKWIGIGEGINDLKQFDAQAFAEALFADK